MTTLGSMRGNVPNNQRALEASSGAYLSACGGIGTPGVSAGNHVIRQSIPEISAILDDFKKYSDEYTRRSEIKNRPQLLVLFINYARRGKCEGEAPEVNALEREERRRSRRGEGGEGEKGKGEGRRETYTDTAGRGVVAN